jgi:hypothetical protein
LRRATGWTAGVLFPAEARDSSLLHSVQTESGPTQPPIQWVTEALSPGVKRPGIQADHAPLPSAEVENVRTLPPVPHTSSRCDAQGLYLSFEVLTTVPEM